MALLEKHLVVKKSGIPNAGKGLFTKVFIPKGTRIVEYKGRVSTWKDVKDEDGRNGYIFFVNRNHVIDALPVKSALARYANDARGLVRVKGLTNNCDYVTEGKRAYIEAKRDIPAGSEILVDYGSDYWKTIRENLKLWAKEEREKAKAKASAKKKSSKKAATKKTTGKKASAKKASTKKKTASTKKTGVKKKSVAKKK
jgi:SET domain-containing protein